MTMLRHGEFPQSTEPPDTVIVLTADGHAVWEPGPRRVTRARPCVIDRRGATLYRWPMRSIFVPLESIDRFDVKVLSADTFDLLTIGMGVPQADGTYNVERLVLLTCDGKVLLVPGREGPFSGRWSRLPLSSRAQHLNNELMKWRTGVVAAATPGTPTPASASSPTRR
jgi:hypothetical protein